MALIMVRRAGRGEEEDFKGIDDSVDGLEVIGRY